MDKEGTVFERQQSGEIRRLWMTLFSNTSHFFHVSAFSIQSYWKAPRCAGPFTKKFGAKKSEYPGIHYPSDPFTPKVKGLSAISPGATSAAAALAPRTDCAIFTAAALALRTDCTIFTAAEFALRRDCPSFSAAAGPSRTDCTYVFSNFELERIFF